ALVAPGELSRERQEALYELIARSQVAVAVVLGQEPAVLTHPGLGWRGGVSLFGCYVQSQNRAPDGTGVDRGNKSAVDPMPAAGTGVVSSCESHE
ncbi:MAG: hypothetical protein QOC95_1222, partial [Thermoleophilaceae bacterium]|nr:hypothetical protein [Thermoleophilaceae bacterium]